jgi:hypothetical protein
MRMSAATPESSTNEGHRRPRRGSEMRHDANRSASSAFGTAGAEDTMTRARVSAGRPGGGPVPMVIGRFAGGAM